MSSFRRLAKDHAGLRASPPPNYLFSPSDDSESLPDDLSQLSIYLTGSEGTPYSAGLWLLHLRIPHDYPKSPPKATFKTRIFHPNVEESTGAVCLETLKRDWDPKLTLKDILVTISCLLIQPNPDSALNEKAGVLVREDYEGFVRHARLMTKIHAPVPEEFIQSVSKARRRGEEEDIDLEIKGTRNTASVPTLPQNSKGDKLKSSILHRTDSTDSSKENDPIVDDIALSSTSSRSKRQTLGKRPLSEAVTMNDAEEGLNLQATHISSQHDAGERPHKSPKQVLDTHAGRSDALSITSDGKVHSAHLASSHEHPAATTLSATPELSATLQKSAPAKYRTYARIGIRRL